MEAQGIPKTEQGAIENDSTIQNTFDGNSGSDSGRAVVSSNSNRGDFRLSSPSLLADSGEESEGLINENGTPQTTTGASLLPGNRAAFPVADHAERMADSVAVDDGSGGESLAETVGDAHVPCTRAKDDSTITKQTTWTGRQLVEWAIGNYALDPVQNSKNRWRIRIRCRKVGCVHSDHIALKTISFMDDPAYRRIARSKRKYADWKKQIIAENAATLRQSD